MADEISVGSESGERHSDTSLSTSDRRALAAYEEYCNIQRTPMTEAGRNAWLREWRGLDEEQRQDAVHAERQALHWPQARDEEPASREEERGPDTDRDR
jgi:hypothetical protein